MIEISVVVNEVMQASSERRAGRIGTLMNSYHLCLSSIPFIVMLCLDLHGGGGGGGGSLFHTLSHTEKTKGEDVDEDTLENIENENEEESELLGFVCV